MGITRRGLLGAGTALALPLRGRAQASPVKIGVLTDMSGPFRDLAGPGSLACVRQAVQEAGRHGLAVEVLSADHQNKPDIGASIARQWIDRDGVNLIVDVPNSSVALAVNSVVREKNAVFIDSGAGTTDLTGAQCGPNTVHWTYDTYMLARSTGGATVRLGGDSWFFLTADYVFGQQLQRDTARFVTEGGGKVVGSAAYPLLATTDFSSFLLQAQASGAKVLGLANAGADTVNCIKQAHEFGLTPKIKLAAMLMFITDVHALGLEAAGGLILTESFYWDLNDRTRAFTERVLPAMGGSHPGSVQAGCYAGALHYLKAVAALGGAGADGAAVVAKMKSLPTDDDAFGAGSIRDDGRRIGPAYLFEVKAPTESKGAWDYYRLAATTPADQAWRPLAAGGCPLAHA